MREMDRYDSWLDRELADRYWAVDVLGEQKLAWIENRICDLLTDLGRDADDLHWYFVKPGQVKLRDDFASWVVGEQKDDLCRKLGACDKTMRDEAWLEYARERADDEAESRDWS